LANPCFSPRGPPIDQNCFACETANGTPAFPATTVELAELLKTHRPNISKAIKLLCDLGLLAQVRKDGKHFVYKINPSIMWKGRETERQEMLKLLQGGKS
jgi:hypothetical protein